jgi:putative redox protein
VKHDKISGQTPPDTFERRITLEGPLDAEQTAKLMEIADKCPVHRTLEGGAKVVTAPIPPAGPVSGNAEEHFRDMDAECRKDGAA